MTGMAPRKAEPKPPTAAQIRAIRDRLGLTQTEAAEKIGVGKRQWIGYESGKRTPSPSVAILIRLLGQGKII